MKKPKLYYREQDYPCFNLAWVRPWVDQHFDMVLWCPESRLRSEDTVLTVYQREFEADAWYRPLEQAGHRILVDHLWDSDTDTEHRLITDRKLELRSPHWSWYSSVLHDHSQGYDQWSRQPAWSWDLLCLMNKQRPHRDCVARYLTEHQPRARWSYVERGRSIGDDSERSGSVYWCFYNSAEWYNSTPWSLVVESWMRGNAWFAAPEYPNYRTEISEKSYKPLAYWHPAVTVGSEGTLRFLRSEGFETWDNLWDESYDAIASDEDRLTAVLELVTQVTRDRGPAQDWDRETLARLAHNRARYWDLDLVHSRFVREIMEPVQEFVCRT